MGLRIGDKAPNFEIETTQGKIDFHDWAKGSWVFFFSHPADYTPVCTTEMGRTSQLAPEFAKRNVKPLGLSTDTVEAHNGWINDVNDTQNTLLEFPIVADQERKVAELYDMIHPGESQTATVRSVFIIDPEQKIRLTMTYPMTVGRNFAEILRVIDALQTTDSQEVACPADWVPGDRVIIRPTVSEEDAQKKFPQGYETLRPYLRLTDINK
ncbi:MULTISPECIES: peroxiredoxin [unclassified Idiomarina]|uniref:peroxiredoxin n=1 Tax=unclassified Idiomarina TaxID=2614829 RepID=UPI0008F89DAE|nr:MULTISPECIES: peroxiredoxin [unclassified Idiomarina]MAD53591.1 peroxiredoxin [Idiomarinaceae bacterium]MEC7643661.1 peroxiredoxin [Pseudomonadota bacterium]OIM99126.1 peroxidase [Idiomarina sp. MD25a]|tara:strand:+ start:2212 stop:2844 length:633 start_codon:yes stop_codon:yes gene_type:complete